MSTERIRKLNDAFRCDVIGHGRVNATTGITDVSDNFLNEVWAAVRAFDDFSEGNDPYGEHDFGALTVGEHKIFWKIDYYNRDLTAGSDDAANPDVTCRVLTMMLASEY